MKIRYDFDEIRPYYDEEVPAIIEKLSEVPAFEKLLRTAFPDRKFEEVKALFASVRTKDEFQLKMALPFLEGLAQRTTTNGVQLFGIENISKNEAYTFISNHRDIILDSAFFCIRLLVIGYQTSEIAIGDNLLVYPWISDLVRANKSFVVQRDVSVRRMLEVSRRLSTYINFDIKIKKQSVWIAQREGRAKNSNDRTQESLLKMLNMGGHHSVLRNLRGLNIAPLAISYEYDPCDFLKAKEFQLKRDNAEYKKTQQDDLLSMQTGLFGFKGRVVFRITPCIGESIDLIDDTLDKATQFTQVAQLIDTQIHLNYELFPINYVALDMRNGNDAQSSHYTEQQKQEVLAYFEKQLARIDIPGKDDQFLLSKLYEMYAYPLINHLEAVAALNN